MDKMNPIVSGVLIAVATAIVLGIGAKVMGVFDAGTAAVSEQQIKDVLADVLLRDNGQTYAASLVTVETTVVRLETKVEALEEDVDDLESDLLSLVND